MVKLIYKSLLGILFIGLVADVKSQTDESDWESWSSISLKYKLNKKWRFRLEEQLRLKEDFSTIDKYFSELSAKYKVYKRTEIGLALRYFRDNDNQGKIQGYENHLRYAVFLNYRHNIKRVTLSYRLQYQFQNELGVTAAEGDESRDKIRFKIISAYNIKKWKLDPKVSIEVFRNFSSTDALNKLRWTVGTDYSILKKLDAGVFFRQEHNLFSAPRFTSNIIGLKLGYKI